MYKESLKRSCFQCRAILRLVNALKGICVVSKLSLTNTHDTAAKQLYHVY